MHPCRRFARIERTNSLAKPQKIDVKTGVTLLILVLFVIGFAGIALTTGWDETVTALSRIGPQQLAILLGLSLINYGFRILRWHVYTRAINIPTDLAQDTRHYLGGFALTATPGRLGELIRLRWIYMQTGLKPDRTGALVLIDRAADLAAAGLLLGAALLLASPQISKSWIVAGLAIALALVATNPSLIRFGATLGWRIFGVFPKFFASIRRAASAFTTFVKLPVSLPATALGMLGWCAEAYAFYLLLMWMGADIGMAAAFAIFFFSMLSGGATGLPGGIGGAEAAMVATLTYQGVPLEIAIPATAVIRITTLWFAILIGLMVFPFTERYAKASSIEVRDALEEAKL